MTGAKIGAMTAVTGARTATMTAVSVGMTAATADADPGCSGDSAMRARTSTPTAVLPPSHATRVHGSVTW
jgi:Spy/CpxP family protein refolding chaperone